MTRRTSIAVILASSAFAQSSEDGRLHERVDFPRSGRYRDALHFPHFILDEGRFTEYSSREQFVARDKSLWDSAPREWDHSEWVKRQIVQRIGDTVHVPGTWVRKDKAGKTIYSADARGGGFSRGRGSGAGAVGSGQGMAPCYSAE